MSPKTRAMNARRAADLDAYAGQEAKRLGPNGQPLYVKVTVLRGEICRFVTHVPAGR